jgi:hypothetical protein
MNAKRLHMWTIYDHPTDWPDVFIARLWLVDDKGWRFTRETRAAKTLDEVRGMLPRGLTCLSRAPIDDPKIVESWL